MPEHQTKPLRIPNTGPRRFGVDAAAMLIYLLIVYAWSLSLHPLGRDYAALADAASLPPVAGRLFAWEMSAFGGSPYGYHAVNLVLLYGCMVALYRFVRLTIPGPFWLGTLAAALFMANPVHSEAVLNLAGVGDLAPAFFALAALAAYAEHRANPKRWTGPLAAVAFALAVLPYRQNVMLMIVPALYVWLKSREPQPARCADSVACPICSTLLVPLAVVTTASMSLHSGLFALENLNPARMFGPLYLIFYPIGLLPETAYTFHRNPWLGWVAALAVLIFIALIYRKARRPAILFGLASMAGMRLFQGGGFIDPVHMIGGGSLLVPNGLFNVALVALFYRIAEHPKWRRPVIMTTTLLAVVFFAMQIVFIAHWREAAQVVRNFQTAAALSATPVGIIPDYRAYRGAPVGLSESISHDTPFSRRIDHVSLLPIDYVPADEHNVQVTEQSAEAIVCRVEASPPIKVVPWPFDLARAGAVVHTAGATIEVVEMDQNSAQFRIRPDVQPRSLVGVREATYPESPEAAPPPAPAPQAVLAAAGEAEKGAEMETADSNELTPEQRQLIEKAGWRERAGASRAVWVSITDQTMRVVENDKVIWQAKCSTAEKGPGFKLDSNQTPLGWHSVAEKIGEGQPWGRVFREKRPARKIWKPGENTKKDLVLTRVLALTGEEPGVNKGGDVDSYRRCIYIHGTNDEARIGTPVSHGCIRLTNDDVIKAFDLISQGAAVLITE
ncbi:MAG TPA: L,D-transpeptidase [Candidatus Bathyarchaeia archaeon]|nr:L,D-transpeptidase [Candidatus Bathyarchaeia archaeon]